MKLVIDKLPSGKLRVAVGNSSSAKPLVFEVAADQLESLVRMLQIAAQSDKFSFALQL